jgi:ribosomal RNA-processing protein 8
MREKLISARFRHLNETLYTRPSEEAFNLFDESPEMFDEYHEGFRRQVKVWPENPVDSFLKDIRARGKVRQQGKGRPGAPPTPLAKTPLPRTQQECTIADLGCGDARLAEALQSDGKKLKVNVKSYDLQSPSPLVTKADIANLPLADGSVNVAVFCLALMGTNWVDFIEEAYRILHWKGELWVAEIKSRFGPIRNKNAPVTHSVGNRKKNAMAGKKGKKGADNDAEHDEDLAVEVDGMDDRRRETDVSAFVEVLRSRGFVLQGDREAIDLSNKMFVKMHFIKGASPTKGKHVKEQEAPKGKRGIIRRIDPIDEQPEFNEASVLKPCVYKIR